MVQLEQSRYEELVRKEVIADQLCDLIAAKIYSYGTISTEELKLLSILVNGEEIKEK